jgi:carbon monoxide dehydrogenase subunit G
MEFRRTVRISAPLDSVWSLVEDIPAVAGCIPGLHDLVEKGPDTFDCVLGQRVGSVKANFALTTTLTELVPKASVTAVTEGRDKALQSNVKATQRFLLSAQADETEVEIVAQFQVTGKIATFGHRIISAKAEQVTVETLQNLSRLLEERAAAAAAG